MKMTKKTRTRNSSEFKSFISQYAELQGILFNHLIKNNPSLPSQEVRKIISFLLEFTMVTSFLRSLHEKLISHPAACTDIRNIVHAFQTSRYYQHLIPIFKLLWDFTTSMDHFENLNTKQMCTLSFLTYVLWQERHELSEHVKVLEKVTISSDMLEKIMEFTSRWQWALNEYHYQDSGNIVTPAIFSHLIDRDLSHRKKKTGSYYTPRFICDFMGNTTIRLWILDNTDSRNKSKLFTMKNQESALDYLENWKSFIEIHSTQIHGLLEKLNSHPVILDNSCGSGDFLISMLEHLATLKQALFKQIHKVHPSLDTIKASIIKFQLHGTDISRKAVATARLRLWLNYLSEITREIDLSVFYSLLLNVRVGNSLIGFNDIQKIRNVDHSKKIEENIRELMILRDEVIFNSSITTVNELSKLYQLEQRLAKECDEFFFTTLTDSINQNHALTHHNNEKPLHWPVFFPHAFLKNDGFDIIIGNPPYVRQEQIKELKPLLKQQYQVYDSIADLFVYFFENAHNILSSKGIIAYIVSNKWIRSRYGQNLREFLSKKSLILFLVDLDGYKVFRDANIETCIIFLQKNLNDNIFERHHFIHVTVTKTPTTQKDLIETIKEHGQTLFQKDLGKEWLLFPQDVIKLRKKIERRGKPLKNYFPIIYRGIVTGLNEAFIIDEKTYLQLVENETKHLFKPLIRGKNITQRWRVKHQGEYLIYATKTTIPDLNLHPKLKQYFLKYRSKLLKMSHVKAELKSILCSSLNSKTSIESIEKDTYLNEEVAAKLCHWWVLQDPKDINLFLRPKIMYPDIATIPLAVFDDQGLVFNNTVYFITHDNLTHLFYLLGFLNSRVFEFYYKTVASKIGKRGYRFFTQFVEKTPLVIPSNLNSCPQLGLIKRLVQLKEEKLALELIRNYEDQLNEWYYSLYGITSKEKEIIEEFLQQQS